MRRIFSIFIAITALALQAFAQSEIKVEAPNVVAADEQFNVTFIIEGENEASDFNWSAGNDFQLVWGPQKGSSTSIQIINGKRSSSHQTTYTYILMPKSTGSFVIPQATARVKGNSITSSAVTIQVVSEGSSASSSQPSGGESQSGQVSSGDISSSDLFMRLTLSKSEAVVGEPITATLKLFQRVNIAGFENAKFPSFNGFWSQETYAPTNIEFKRESFDDKIYNTAVLRSYVLIPQQTGTITIDPAELVCLVNVRVSPSSSGSIFDSFFQDDYRTIRKRVTTPALRVKVNPLPSGQPASFGGGVGNFGISARLTADDIKTHDAASLIVTVSGRGNVALLEAPKVNFPPDFEVYDTKTTQNTDNSTGGTSGSKSFEFPFIPRSHGDFTIPSIEYSYYDVNSGRYVTLHTDPLNIKVSKGKGGDAQDGQASVPSIERSGVRNISNDIRFISTKRPNLDGEGNFFLGSGGFWIILAILIIGALATASFTVRVSARKADVVGTKNRRATKMALGRLRQAQEYLDKNLYSAYYEELHKALLGYVSDKLNMDMSEISKDNIENELVKNGASEDQSRKFIGLLDACEFARYSPDSGNEEMKGHFDDAVNVISSIDSSLKGRRKGPKSGTTAIIAIFLSIGLASSVSLTAAENESEQMPGGAPLTLNVQDSTSSPSSYSVVPDTSSSSIVDTLSGPIDELWDRGVAAFNDGRYTEAASCWESIAAYGMSSPELFCNLGDAYFKQGNYPRAVLNYERSLKIDPSFKDARFNLDFTNNFVQDKIEPVPEFILKTWARNISRLFSSNTWAWLFLAFLAITLYLVIVFMLAPKAGSRRWGFFLGIVFLVLSLCCLGFSAWQKSDFSKSDDAIVMTPVISVKSSPSDDGGKDLFILHEGTKVQLIDEVGDWRNISLADGRQGWIKGSDIEVI